MLLPILLILAQTPTADFIKEVQPDISEQRLERVAAAIDSASLYYGIDARLLTAIVRQESNFEAGKKACWPAPWKGPKATTCDYGLAQINQQWVKRWGLDPTRLQHDDEYNLMVAARLLAWLERTYARREPRNWFGRYHSGTPSLRAVYEAQLARFIRRGELVAAR